MGEQRERESEGESGWEIDRKGQRGYVTILAQFEFALVNIYT